MLHYILQTWPNLVKQCFYLFLYNAILKKSIHTNLTYESLGEKKKKKKRDRKKSRENQKKEKEFGIYKI